MGTCGAQPAPIRAQRLHASPSTKVHLTLARRQFVQAVFTGGWSLSQVTCDQLISKKGAGIACEAACGARPAQAAPSHRRWPRPGKAHV